MLSSVNVVTQNVTKTLNKKSIEHNYRKINNYGTISKAFQTSEINESLAVLKRGRKLLYINLQYIVGTR